MRKNIIILTLVAILTIGLFPGCASGENHSPMTTEPQVPTVATIPTEAPASTTNTETEINETNDSYDVFDVFTYPGVKELEDSNYHLASRRLPKMGFIETWFDNDVMSDSFRIGLMDDVIVGQMRYESEPEYLWNFRIEKADQLENKTGLEPGPDDIVNDEDRFSERYPNSERSVRAWTPSEPTSVFYENGIEIQEYPLYYVAIYYYPQTKNLYTVYTKSCVQINTQSWDMTGYPEGDPGFAFTNTPNSEIYNERRNDVYVPFIKKDWNNTYTDEFTLTIDGQEVTYRYRYGSSLQEWLHSEYNTDGWHRLPYIESYNEGNGGAVSAKYGYKNTIFGGEYSGDDFVLENMMLFNKSNRKMEFYEEKDAAYDPNKFEIGAFYVVKDTPLHIYGFNMFNTYNQSLYEGGRGPMYRYSGWNVNYKADSTLTIDGIGLREEDGEHMKFLLVPHYVPESDNPMTYEKANGYPYANDMNTIREAATELTAEFKLASELPLFWSEYIDEILPDYGFRLVLDPQKIDGFKTGVAYDICITYDDEVVYWLFMPEFTN